MEQTAQIEEVTIENEYTKTGETTRITGKDYKAVLARCESIFSLYPPQGYGTRYEARPYYFGKVWTAVISRSLSCD